ncbi:YJR141W [Zygosaccharomyces parabailii]|nr:YJR141W [Zygosaccharomyces parabailii]
MSSSSNFLVEYLPRIGTTSIVLEGFKKIVLEHIGSNTIVIRDEKEQSCEILLPHSHKKLLSQTLTKINDEEYLLTLKAEKEQPTRPLNDIMSFPQAKWTKRQLCDSDCFDLCCLQCGKEIINQQNCTKINEMPSEFWTELMDYWHCHKPTSVTSGFYSLRKNSLRPCLNEILIGESFFQALEDTLAGRITVKDSSVLCAECGELLGKSVNDHMYRLYKWKLRLIREGLSDETFPPAQEIVSVLLNCTRANSTRYMLLKSEKKQLLIWLFALGSEVTLGNNRILKGCLKIFYTTDVQLKVGFKTNIEEEEVNLIPFENFICGLKDVNSILPASKRKFGPWDVAYFPVV